jgi:hypothetical protein
MDAALSVAHFPDEPPERCVRFIAARADGERLALLVR